MPHYKLTYFNFRAKGEVIRMLFNLAGVEFEDYRCDYEKEWPQLKPKTPLGKVPVLEIDGDGVLHGESNAIARYIASKYDLYGKSDLDRLRIDMIVYTIDELLDQLNNVYRVETEEERIVIKKKWSEEQAPKMLERLEVCLKQNKEGDGWFVGDEISWADVHFQNWLDYPSFQLKMNFDLKKYPKLDALKKRVESHPKIVDWFSKRPVTLSALP